MIFLDPLDLCVKYRIGLFPRTRLILLHCFIQDPVYFFPPCAQIFDLSSGVERQFMDSSAVSNEEGAPK